MNQIEMIMNTTKFILQKNAGREGKITSKHVPKYDYYINGKKRKPFNTT